jgi:TolB-like protein
MADIFLSYSSKDRQKAEQLTELLSAAGLSVWIDRQGIVGAEQWATEIVEGIRGCNTFIILLSGNSIASENVLRELSLASEKRKRVLPVDLEQVALPSSFEYPLAGLQRVAITDFDKILHAHKHGLEKFIKKDDRKSLMILPFEDLSPTGDNAWFADGIVSELISALSNVKSIRIADNQATKEFKKYHGQLTTYAREMDFRYFVQGDVRKFGDNIKITARLLDIETGDNLWQDSMKGVMDNIFDFQEEVALKVVEGLKVHLADDEKKKLAERGTENVDAYELFMKAIEYYHRQTKEGFQLAAQLLSDAILLDPAYAQAYRFKANTLAALYRSYDRTPALLDEAELLCKEALQLQPDLTEVYQPLSNIYRHRGMLAEAEEAAKEYVRKAPESSLSHFTLGFYYANTDQVSKAIIPWEEAVRLKPDIINLFNLAGACAHVGDKEKSSYWAIIALPHIERYLKLHPDDEGRRVWHASLLLCSGKINDAREAAKKLTDLKQGVSLQNAAILFAKLGEKEEALSIFRKAIETGYKNIQNMNAFLTLEEDGIVSLNGTSEYEIVKKMVEEIELEAAITNG